MDELGLSIEGTDLKVTGAPDAVKVIEIDDPRAKELADLKLHQSDLHFAKACLEEVNRQKGNYIVREALWRSALISYTKCFGNSNARKRLDALKTLEGDSEGVSIHGYFWNLRRKHIAHDDNAYSQSITGAAINNGEKPYKIEKIVCMSFESQTLQQDSYSNLLLLTNKALASITARFNEVCAELTEELEKVDYKILSATPEPKYTAPTVEDIGKTRR